MENISLYREIVCIDFPILAKIRFCYKRNYNRIKLLYLFFRLDRILLRIPGMLGKRARKIGKSGVFPAILLSALVVWLAPSVALGNYRYTDIHPDGWISSRALCVNAFGEVAGYGTTASGERGFLWTAGTTTVILPPDADGARATWVNGRGDVVGTWTKDGVSHAFLLRDGAFIDPTPGWSYSEAHFVGEDGAVGGTGEFGAFVSRDGVVEILPGLSVVVAGNSSGQFVGEGDASARLYSPGTGYLDLTPPGTEEAAPKGINENGRVAVSSLKDGVDRGFVYSAPFFVAMTPDGWTSSVATAINDQEMVTGYGDSPTGRKSFLRSGGTYEILAYPGWTSTEAESVNDVGQVTGAGVTAAGETHAFVASPASAPTAEIQGAGASGGCSVARPDARSATPASAAVSLLLLVLPLLVLRRRLGLRAAE